MRKPAFQFGLKAVFFLTAALALFLAGIYSRVAIILSLCLVLGVCLWLIDQLPPDAN